MEGTAKKQQQEFIRLGDVIIDPDYQVRMKTDRQTVTNYVEAMKEGDIFPPIVIEKSTGKLVCGFTRMEAYTKVYPPSESVPVTFRDFTGNIERRLFSAKDNSRHGQPLSKWDKNNIIDRLIKDGANPEEISSVLGWKIDRIERVGNINIFTINPKPQKTSTKKGGKKGKVPATVLPIRQPKSENIAPYVLVNGEAKVLKRGLEHLNGKTISQDIYQYIVGHYTGWSDQYIAEQLIKRIEYGIINDQNENTRQSLFMLIKKLDEIGIAR